MALRNRMAILSETFAHDRFYKRVHAANVFIEEILEYTHIHGNEIRRINREADQRVTQRADSSTEIENGVQFEMVPLEETLDLLSYKYIPYTNSDGDADFVRSSEIVTIEGVLNYNRFEPALFSSMPDAYIFPAEYFAVADKLRQHGIAVETLQQDATLEVEQFLVSGLEPQSFPLNSHQNVLLSGEFRETETVFSAGDYLVPMNNRLANLIFYLLEPQSDDGLGFWNFFDEELQAALDSGQPALFPVSKLMSR